MKLIFFLLIGLAAGWIAGEIMKSRRGVLANMGVGVAGAFIGGFLARLVGLAATGLLGSLILAVVGAVVFLWVLNRLK